MWWVSDIRYGCRSDKNIVIRLKCFVFSETSFHTICWYVIFFVNNVLSVSDTIIAYYVFLLLSLVVTFIKVVSIIANDIIVFIIIIAITINVLLLSSERER